MKNKIFLSIILFIAIFLSSRSFAQLTGPISIPSSNYPTIAAAIDSLNLQGVGAGGVVFNVTAGHKDTMISPTAGTITATGTSSDQIVFQKFGIGANPLITAALNGTGIMDGIIKIAGGDYITFDGIDLQDNSGNTDSTKQMEWGYSLHRVDPTNGSRNVVIKNCNITLQKANSNSIGIFVSNKNIDGATITSLDATYANSFNKFFGNSISNVRYGMHIIAATSNRDSLNEIGVAGLAANNITDFGSNKTSEGIRCEGQSSLKVSNNIINGGTGTAQTIYGILVTASGTGTNVADYEISYNRVTITVSSGNYAHYGIRALGTGNTVDIHNNIIENCDVSNGTSTFTALSHAPSGTTPIANIYNNVIQNNTHSGTGILTLLGGTGTITTLNIYSNRIQGNQKTGASGSIYCIETATAKVNCYDNTVYNNSMPNSSGTSAASVYGYRNTSSNVVEEYIYDNLFYNLLVEGTSTSTSSVVYGIYPVTGSSSNTGTKWIYGNTIHSFSSTVATVAGIYQQYGSLANIYNNNIYNLSTTATSSTSYVAGIIISGSSGTAITYIYNNFISDLRAPGSNNLNGVIGVNATLSAANSSIMVYYNTIYLDAVSSGTNFGSSGISSVGSATATSATLDLRNNIIVNSSTPSGTGLTVALRRTNPNLGNYSANSNNNDLFAGTPSATNLIYYDGTNSDQSIAEYQARVTPRDVASFSVMPPFVNVTTKPYNLHIQTTVMTKLESGGVEITTPIAVNTDFDGDLRFGAPGYGGSGTAPDVGADEFEGVSPAPMVYTSSTTTQNTDAVFANTANNHIVGIEVVTTGYSSPLTVSGFTLNTNGSTNAAVDISNAKIFYTGTSNTFGTAIQFGSDYASPPAAPATFSITGNQTLVNGTNYFWLAYDIPVSATNGNVIDAEVISITIEDTARTPTVTAPSGNRTIIAGLLGSYTISPSEPYPFNSFNNVASLLGSAGVKGPVILNVQPGSGPYNEQVEFTAIPGVSETNTVIINGNGESLTFAPTDAKRYLIRLNGAQRMTINNLVIVGNDTTYGWGVHFMNAANYNVISNCTIDLSKGKNTSISIYTLVGIVATASTTSISAAGNNANYCVFSGNAIQGGADGGPQVGIRLNGNTGGIDAVGNQIINNTIRDFHEYGIYLGNNNGTLISSNDINRANRLAVTIFRGITLGAGCQNVHIEKNRIHTTNATTAADPSATAYGIHFDGADAPVGKENVAVNNMIYNFNSVSGNIYAIYSYGSDGAHCFYNSISIDHADATGGPTRGFFQNTTAANVDFRNNIISITRGGTGSKHCIYLGAPGSTVTSNYNLYYINAPAGTNYTGYLSGNFATLTDWQTTGHDLNSLVGNPMFISLDNIHINTSAYPPSPANDNGTPIAGITEDFDGDTRSDTKPDIGADEFEPTSFSVSVNINAGWNMISNPVLRDSGTNSVNQLYPTSLNNYVFAYLPGTGYTQRSVMENGSGYWGKFPEAATSDIVGAPITLDSIDVMSGWNMVGSISYAIDTSTITSVPAGIRSSFWYGYNNGYSPASQIIPGKAYWVKVNPSGKFIFASGGSVQKTHSGISELDGYNTITVMDNAGNSQTLYFGADNHGQTEVEMYEMPPLPPSGVFDARFEGTDGGYMLQKHSSEIGKPVEFPISVQSSNFPITITWKINSDRYSYELNDGLEGKSFGVQTIAEEGKMTITNTDISRLVLLAKSGDGLPVEFALMQNYPNPFNPVTNIKFALPELSKVAVEIYNILGQKVQTLINEERSTGYHIVEWNGMNDFSKFAGSGVYYVKISAEGSSGKNFTKIRKMILLR